ncbi:MAG: PorV/PorQ family protein [Candidatus Cloacimonetes bacterium]|nr:PorV/PorQ family protein [Candidatus Cloacimonadota bacterium]
MKVRKIYLIVILFLCSSYLFGRHEEAGTTGFAFMKMNYSARALGMGNAFTALSNDGDAVFFNPAGLAQGNDMHIKTSYKNYIEGLNGGSIVFVTNYGDNWRIAPFLNFLASDEIPKMIEINLGEGHQIGTFNTFSVVAGAGFAKTFNEHFDLGFNLKYFYESLDTYSASAVAGDLAVLHTTTNENLKIGAVLRNLGVQTSHYTEENYDEGMPLTVVVGASYKFGEKGFLNFDLVRPLDNDFYGRLGLEFYYNTYFTVRAGLDTRMNDYRTDEKLDYLSGLTFGLGFNWNKYVVDYGISSMGGLGIVNQISLSYLF